MFRTLGAWMARSAAGHPRTLLAQVFGVAAVVTAVLSLDATVVLLTPVVFVTAARLGARPRPHVHACAHLSNTGSLLLPVSNLTNLLAFSASGLGFVRFSGLMALPWISAIAVEYVVFRRYFRGDLDAGATAPAPHPPLRVPVFALVTVGCTLAGFALASSYGVSPMWAAAAGATVLAVRALTRHEITPSGLVRAAGLPFCAFVVALAVVVRAVVDNGLGSALGRIVPDGSGLFALLGTAALAAVLANLINNLPATLVLVPLAATTGPGAVLAVLLGVNIGPNLTYAGSLATLLWRRVLHHHDHEVGLGEFTRLGALTVPACLAVATVALWGSLRLVGA